MMTPRLHVLYLVHDVHDPAAGRRMAMLQAGGASVTLAGFRRGDGTPDVAGVTPIDLGATHDGRFAHRLAAVAKAGLALGGTFARIARPDVIVARNLEMLALGQRLRARFGGDVPIIYECLDIHRLMLRPDALGAAMRMAERRLARSASLLVTSSPAFLCEYFAPFGQIDAPVLLVENKVLELTAAPPSPAAKAPAEGGPWRIGWFGALRCRRSLALLAAFTRRMQGRFEVVLRGRPARSEFDDFDAAVAAEPYLRFEGPYRNPDDLADIYGAVHYAWAIDFFEQGRNSSWLLPNRLYEGCRHGAVPIAMAETETARFLQRHGIGLVLGEPSDTALAALLGDEDARSLASRRARIAAKPVATWSNGHDDCRALVARLESLKRGGVVNALLEAAT